MFSWALESHEGQRCSKSAHNKCKSTTTLRGSEERGECGKNPRWGCGQVVTLRRGDRGGGGGGRPGDICHRSCISQPTQELSNANLPGLTRKLFKLELEEASFAGNTFNDNTLLKTDIVSPVSYAYTIGVS